MKNNEILLIEETKFRRHLSLEFFHRCPFRTIKQMYLNEIHGYFNDEDIIGTIINDIETKGFPYILKEKDKFKGYFFDDIELIITTNKDENINTIIVNGGYIANKSGFVTVEETGKKKYTVNIKINIKYPSFVSFDEILSNIKFVLSHELLHAYDDYNERKNNTSIINKAYNNGYYLNKFSNSKNVFKKFNYLINSIERNAFIGQLKRELEDRLFEMESINATWKILKQTKSYGKFLYLENFVNNLNSMTDKSEQEKVIKDYNSSNGTELKTYNKLLKTINRKWYKYKKKYINTVSKIVYDIFYENFHIIN